MKNFCSCYFGVSGWSGLEYGSPDPSIAVTVFYNTPRYLSAAFFCSEVYRESEDQYYHNKG